MFSSCGGAIAIAGTIQGGVARGGIVAAFAGAVVLAGVVLAGGTAGADRAIDRVFIGRAIGHRASIGRVVIVLAQIGQEETVPEVIGRVGLEAATESALPNSAGVHGTKNVWVAR